MSIWRIQTNTSKSDIADYCIRNNIAAVGWSLLDYADRSNLNNLSYSGYCELAKTYYNSFGSLNRLACELKVNDLIWMRKEGIYYLARIEENSSWFFNNSDEATSYDACNQVSNVKWIRIGDESDIPGALSTSFIRGSTLQRIKKQGVTQYSELIYDRKSNDSHKYNRTIELSESNFYSLISPSDCEDLLYIYSYAKSNGNYVCIPSTNKISTEKYEFVALDAATGKHIYYQVKNGNVSLDADNYFDLIKEGNGTVLLLTTHGKVYNKDKYSDICVVNPTELFDFACSEENSNILPPNIKYWMEFAGGYNILDGEKGIMIDTNSDESEMYMFKNSVIAAWGSPKRYIDAFNKGDYVFFYKKCFGIIAVGKIISDKANEIENGKEHKVEMIVGPERLDSGDYISIKPNQIKETLKKSFFFASTRKVPFLNNEESLKLLDKLKNKKV